MLDMYNMNYEAQEPTRPGDGRHNTVFFNDLLLMEDYFYPTNEWSTVAVQYELTVRSRYQGNFLLATCNTYITKPKSP